MREGQQPNEALVLLEVIRWQGLEPRIHTYSADISAFVLGKQQYKALALLTAAEWPWTWDVNRAAVSARQNGSSWTTHGPEWQPWSSIRCLGG